MKRFVSVFVVLAMVLSFMTMPVQAQEIEYVVVDDTIRATLNRAPVSIGERHFDFDWVVQVFTVAPGTVLTLETSNAQRNYSFRWYHPWFGATAEGSLDYNIDTNRFSLSNDSEMNFVVSADGQSASYTFEGGNNETEHVLRSSWFSRGTGSGLTITTEGSNFTIVFVVEGITGQPTVAPTPAPTPAPTLAPRPAPTGLRLDGSIISWNEMPEVISYFTGIYTFDETGNAWGGNSWVNTGIWLGFADGAQIDLSKASIFTYHFDGENWISEMMDYEWQAGEYRFSISAAFADNSFSETAFMYFHYPFATATLPTPTPAPTPQPTPTPAPVVTLPTPVGLTTTERLVSVVPPAPVAGQPLQYTVQPGETLWSIAFNFYGSMQTATVNRILNANRNIIPVNNRLTAGLVLTLPAQGLRDPITRTHLDNAPGLYLVQAGDTLASIANRFYGNSNEWGRIHEANRVRVPNANRIYEGQWLVIPNR
jgi:LysM repeat protein